VLLLAEACRDAGHDVQFFAAANTVLADFADQRQLPVCAISRTRRSTIPIPRLRNALRHLAFARRLDRGIRRFEPDVILASNARSTLALWVSGLRRRPPIVTWIQSDIGLGAVGTVAGLFASRLGLIDPTSRDAFGPRTQQIVQRRFRPLPSGRDLRRFETKRTVRDSTKLEVVTVCMIHPRKGLDTLIDACASAGAEIHLTVVGAPIGPAEVEYRRRLLERVDEHELDVDFVGWQDDVTPFLRSADVFVLASHNEGLPGAIIEAMASGLPIITTRSGGSGQLVRAARAGIDIDPGDTPALADALLLLAADPARRHELGKAGAAFVGEHYGLDGMYDAFMHIVGEVVAP
jgi:glycosyltransferase involved in cell wall biosynthesis